MIKHSMGKIAVVTSAPAAWSALNGLFSVYKPPDKSMQRVKDGLITNICRTMNQLEPRPVADFVAIEGSPQKPEVIVRPNYADHPLVVGPRYQQDDVKLSYATKLGARTSGVFVWGINGGVRLAWNFHMARLLRTYRLKARLGIATDNMFHDGKIVQKAKFDHVRTHHLDRVLATFEANHQKQMFLQSGVDLQSDAAYELATKGLVRPSASNVPMIYSFKRVEFEPPDFTIEIQCINEYEDYLLQLIHDIGVRLRTLAVCYGVQCTKHGCFTVDHTLVRRQWTVEHIINNISLHKDVLRASKLDLRRHPHLVAEKSEEIT